MSVENFGEVVEVFLLENTHRTLTVEALDIGPASGVLSVSNTGETVRQTVRLVSVGRGPNTVPTSDGV